MSMRPSRNRTSKRTRRPRKNGRALSDVIDTAEPNDFGCGRWTAVRRERRADPRSLIGGENRYGGNECWLTRRNAAKPWYRILYVQVLIAIVLGAFVGWQWPNLATNDWIKALGDGFIKLIKMVIAPIIFCTVVSGIAHIQDARKVGRIGVKALLYFEVVSTFALVIGLLVGNVSQSGRRLRWRHGRRAAVAAYAKQAESQKSVDFFLHIIPDTRRRRLCDRRDPAGPAVFDSVRFCRDEPWRAREEPAGVRRRGGARGFRRHRHRHEGAPIGAFGAMAFTIGKFGTGAILQSGRPDRDVLSHGCAVRVRGAGHHRAHGRFLDLQVPCLHQGRAADRARHLVFGKRAARR